MNWQATIQSFAASLAFASLIQVQATPVLNSANGHLYDIVDADGITWHDAKHAAAEQGWGLATVTSAAEQNFIAGLLADLEASGEYWIGGYQSRGNSSANSSWHWVTGESFGYTHWAPLEPNDHYGPGSEQHLAIWGLGHGNASLQWNDEGALGNITGYIMERPVPTPAVPEPGTWALMGMGVLAMAFFLRRRQSLA